MIDTTATEPPRNWFLELTSTPTEDLLNEATRLRAKLSLAQLSDHIVEARAYELRLVDVERAIAVHNRRATEAEDQRAAGERTLTEERVREVVREAIVAECFPNDDDGSRARMADAIAARAAKELAGAVVGLSERDQEILSVLIDDVQAFGAGDDDDRKDDRFQGDTLALLRRLKRNGAQREADLREAFLAGAAWAAGPTIVEAAKHHREVGATEYARSKAGG